jgi:hypothetical protein
MLVAWAGRTSWANNGCVLYSTIRYPTDVQDFADAFQLLACLFCYRSGATTLVATRLNLIDGDRCIESLRRQRWRQVNSSAHNVRVAGRICAANGLATVKSFVISVS